ncbi:MAG: hypothetical protein RIC19_24290 [Phaeodactylibacter sp.]
MIGKVRNLEEKNNVGRSPGVLKLSGKRPVNALPETNLYCITPGVLFNPFFRLVIQWTLGDDIRRSLRKAKVDLAPEGQRGFFHPLFR